MSATILSPLASDKYDEASSGNTRQSSRQSGDTLVHGEQMIALLKRECLPVAALLLSAMMLMGAASLILEGILA